MAKEIQIILTEKKKIRGRKIKAGTVVGIIVCGKRFRREDIDLSMQLGEIKIVEGEKEIEEKKKPAEENKE